MRNATRRQAPAGDVQHKSRTRALADTRAALVTGRRAARAPRVVGTRETSGGAGGV